MSNNKPFIEYVGNCFLNSCGVVAYRSGADNVYLAAVNVVNGKILPHAEHNGLAETIISTAEYNDTWANLHDASTVQKALIYVGAISSIDN